MTESARDFAERNEIADWIDLETHEAFISIDGHFVPYMYIRSKRKDDWGVASDLTVKQAKKVRKALKKAIQEASNA